MGNWGIAETAPKEEKIKAEFFDVLGGLTRVGAIDDTAYNELSDEFEKVTEKLTQLKAEKSGEWVDVGVSDFDDTDRCYRCSVCGKEINGYDIGYYFKFCHGCGAKMGKEANQ